MASSSSSSSSSTKVSLKLLIDTRKERVLFAEASKDFVDFLFNLLCLPISTVTNLLTKNHMVGCIGNVYESVQNLSDDYLLNPNRDKDVLLKPNAPLISGHLLLPANEGQDGNNGRSDTWTYKCVNGCGYTVLLNTPCPNCNNNIGYGLFGAKHYTNNVTATKSCANAGGGGFVKGVVTYTVMDDLEVCPMSTISTITLISKFGINDITFLKERIVELDMEKGIKLLKASLQCKNVLTSVFLQNEEA